MYLLIRMYVDATIRFNQSAYSVHEQSGSVQPILVLNKPYSTSFIYEFMKVALVLTDLVSHIQTAWLMYTIITLQ